ncbi:hypothetical protein [Streptomyces longwoodensis]|uniref:hypothetical protein n=1 Tax=Streptomyces longwoodensis TaxID=68231 RepID=UPI0036F670A5
MPLWSIHRRPKHLIRRDTKGQVTAYQTGSTVMASAALVSKAQVRTVVGRKQDWQRDAWDLYDTVTELRFGVSWIANACSRARLYVGLVDQDGSSEPTPVDLTPDKQTGAVDLDAQQAVAVLDELGGGQLGQAEMLRRLAIHLNVPGESYLIGFDDPTGQADGYGQDVTNVVVGDDGEEGRRWLVCSADELQSTGAGLKIVSPDMPNEYIEIDPEQSTILRIWRPHPRVGYNADSPLLALRQPLRELVDLSAHITATAESRLAGAGVLFVPDELTTPSPEQSEGANPLHPDPFTAALIEAMAAPLKNRDSASAVVPLVVRGPAEKGKELKHISFSTPLDENVQELRESAIRRVATGMDMPPEVLTGLGDSNHWSAWQVEESAIKLHIEPLLGLICDSLTTNLLRPALKALGVSGWQKYAIWYDTSDLSLRPNRAPEAMDAHKLGLISDEAARRELGFGDEDAPSDAERMRNLVTAVLTNASSLAPSLLPFLGINIPETQVAEANAEAAKATAEVIAEDPQKAITTGATPTPPAAPGRPAARPGARPATGGGGRNAIPQRTDRPITREGLERAMTASARHRALSQAPQDWRTRCLDMAVRRALSRAGQYLIRATPRAQRAQLQQLPPESVHLTLHAEHDQLDQMLRGAYAEFHEATPDEVCLHRAVDHYVRALLLAREEHHPDYLDRAVAQFQCDGEGAHRATA